jgi:hypothetical protein
VNQTITLLKATTHPLTQEHFEIMDTMKKRVQEVCDIVLECSCPNAELPQYCPGGKDYIAVQLDAKDGPGYTAVCMFDPTLHKQIAVVLDTAQVDQLIEVLQRRTVKPEETNTDGSNN